MLSNLNMSTDSAMKTISAVHAFQTEILRNVDMPNNNRASGKFRVYRTEESKVMKLATDVSTGQKVGLTYSAPPAPVMHTLNRGPLESYSSMVPVRVKGEELTVLEIPHHRVIMSYLLSRNTYKKSDFFLGDGENEFVCMTDGIVGEYHGNYYNQQ